MVLLYCDSVFLHNAKKKSHLQLDHWVNSLFNNFAGWKKHNIISSLLIGDKLQDSIQIYYMHLLCIWLQTQFKYIKCIYIVLGTNIFLNMKSIF